MPTRTVELGGVTISTLEVVMIPVLGFLSKTGFRILKSTVPARLIEMSFTKLLKRVPGLEFLFRGSRA